MKTLSLSLALAFFLVTSRAQAQAPQNDAHAQGTSLIVGGAAALFVSTHVPLVVGLGVGLARPGSEYNLTFGALLGAFSLAGTIASIWGIVEGVRVYRTASPPRQSAWALPAFLPSRDGVLFGVVGAF